MGFAIALNKLTSANSSYNLITFLFIYIGDDAWNRISNETLAYITSSIINAFIFFGFWCFPVWCVSYQKEKKNKEQGKIGWSGACGSLIFRFCFPN